ncbi:hypothetical protein [Microbacterium hydrocarbonoxydans]|uniref:hypothetical protein n=1 Tax=Microbacterium hydrocarbonoxydans TaxID=273678 RepID=UPI00203BFB75|nr:hypothetical protein [Microbacterium hydrocarbonoxydans]MCM3778604.1 hypothetical protein [Microbacterium hydrocarbonoxydans]
MTHYNSRAQVRNLLVIAGLSSALLLTSCTGSSDAGDISGDTLEAASTLTAFPPEISIAQALRVQECVRAAGLNMPFDSDAAQSTPLSYGLSNLFTSADEAKRTGYATTISDGKNVVSEWEESLTESDRQKYYSALFGPDGSEQIEVSLDNGMKLSTSKVGCIAEAQTELYGSVESALAFTGLVNEYLTTAGDAGNERDAQVSALAPDYEKCMDAKGYTVDDFDVPALAEELFGAYRAPGEQPGKDEQDLAVADFDCQAEVNLRDTVAAAFAAESADWLKANEGRLLAMQEELRLVQERAVDIING